MGLILFLIICFFIIFGVYLLQNSGSIEYERPMPFAPSYVSPY